MPTPLGHHSPRVARVRELLSPDGRRAAGRVAIEGPTLLAEARRSGLTVREVYATADALERLPEIGALEGPDLPVFVVDERALARMSDVRTPSGIVAVVDLAPGPPEAVMTRPGPIVLLAGIGDPGNAGTLIRSAEAFGAAGVLALPGSVDPLSPKVVRAAMGSLFRLPAAWIAADEIAGLTRAAGRPLVAATLDGEDAGDRLPFNAVVAIGHERHGIDRRLGGYDRTVRIPHAGPAESLNAAVAGSILLYLCARSAL